MNSLRYPIGECPPPPTHSTAAERAQWIEEIAATPTALGQAIAGLTDSQLDTRYRPEGWTVRQVVHHLADSHVHAYARCRLALTESTPVIKAYDEALWAELPDARLGPVAPSLALLGALHHRWVVLLSPLDDAGLRRAYFHPELDRQVTIEEVLSTYAWHGKHHVAHITSLRRREGWD